MDRFEFMFVGLYTYSQLGWGNPKFYIPLCRRNVDTIQFVRNFQTNAIHYIKVGSKMSKLLTDIYNEMVGAIPGLCDIYLRYNRPVTFPNSPKIVQDHLVRYLTFAKG